MHVYAGVHLLAKPAVCLVMFSAVTPTPQYAAVWAGASTPSSHRWVQAGIASINNQPFLYAESNGTRYRLRFSEWLYRLPIRVLVVHRGSWWRATAGPVHTPWVRLRNAVRMGALELVNGAHARARIGGRLTSA